jgi:hypothetical protein
MKLSLLTRLKAVQVATPILSHIYSSVLLLWVLIPGWFAFEGAFSILGVQLQCNLQVSVFLGPQYPSLPLLCHRACKYRPDTWSMFHEWPYVSTRDTYPDCSLGMLGWSVPRNWADFGCCWWEWKCMNFLLELTGVAGGSVVCWLQWSIMNSVTHLKAQTLMPLHGRIALWVSVWDNLYTRNCSSRSDWSFA